MILLKSGNKLPSVAVIQNLLNASTGDVIKVDGIFGSKTKNSVIGFQKSHGLKTDGIVGKKTWPELARITRVVIVDVVDVEDPSLATTEACDIRAAGGRPIIMRGMSNGVGHALSSVKTQYPANTIAILRFHSHGAPGDMNVSAGTGGDSRADLSGISHDNIGLITGQLLSMGSHMLPFGCIEFHGCNVGQGAQGKTLLNGVARASKRPATAGIRSQYGGGYKSFSFEGPTYSGIPGGISLKQWAKNTQVQVSGTVGRANI